MVGCVCMIPKLDLHRMDVMNGVDGSGIWHFRKIMQKNPLTGYELKSSKETRLKNRLSNVHQS